MAQHGNYGDQDKQVDKDHDEKIAEQLGTEADQAKRRALRAQKRDLKAKKREIKKQQLDEKKKDFNKSLNRAAGNLVAAEYGTGGVDGATDYNHDKLLHKELGTE